MWECGLKRLLAYQKIYFDVTPHVGVWIETIIGVNQSQEKLSHSPCGSVD